nr:hypothetical protein Iba_scaffold7178CG0230 [Ipomoea batatas]GME11977.1 hypothetical protein Iba_scaffold13097CG0020 [Ipomoea batatas]
MFPQGFSSEYDVNYWSIGFVSILFFPVLRLSISFLHAWQSFVLCPWQRWYLQYLGMSAPGGSGRRGERIALPKEIVDHRSGSPFVAGKPGKKVALCRRLLETVVAEDSPSLPEAGEEVTGLGDGAVGPRQLLPRGLRKLLLRHSFLRRSPPSITYASRRHHCSSACGNADERGRPGPPAAAAIGELLRHEGSG